MICVKFCINVLIPSQYKPAGDMLGLIKEERGYVYVLSCMNLASVYWQESEKYPRIGFLECLIKGTTT